MSQTLVQKTILGPPKILNCAIYTRVSTDEQTRQEFSSIDAQRKMCLDFVKTKAGDGWRVCPDRYDDGGYSGKNLERPAAQQLIQDVLADKIQVIVVYRMDRLFRNLRQQLYLTELFGDKGVKFYADGQPQEFLTPNGFMTSTILGAAAQMERMLTSQRTKDKIRESKKLGKWCGGHVPLGYDRKESKDAKELVVNKAEAAQVKEMYEIYLREQSLDRALKFINAKYRTKSLVTEKGKVRGGRPFAKTAVFHILRNRVYLGQVHLAPDWVDGRHKPIVSAQLFNRVQVMLARNGHAKTSLNRSIHKNKYALMLRGLVRCTVCGAMMTPYHARGRSGQRYEYYKCTKSQHGGKAACAVKLAPARALEGLVLGRIEQLAHEPNLVKKAVQKSLRKSNDEIPALKAQLSQKSARRQQIEAEANNLLRRLAGTKAQTSAFVVKHLDELETELKALEEEQTLLAAKLAEESMQAMDPATAQKNLLAIHKLYAQLTPEERQRLLKLTIREVQYSGDLKTIKMSLHPFGGGGSFLDSDFGTVPFGSPGWIRTSNPPINSRMLHH